MTVEKCAAEIWSSDHWHKYACSKPATITEDGKWWCGIHAPSRVKARRQKRTEKWAKQDQLQSARWAVKRAYNGIAEVALADPLNGSEIAIAVQKYRDAEDVVNKLAEES